MWFLCLEVVLPQALAHFHWHFKIFTYAASATIFSKSLFIKSTICMRFLEKVFSVEANYGSLLLHVTHGRVWRGSHHVLLQNSDIAKLNISCNLWVTKTYHELMKIIISHGPRQLTAFCGWINSKTERALNMSCSCFCHKISIVCLYYSLLFLCILVPSL